MIFKTQQRNCTLLVHKQVKNLPNNIYLKPKTFLNNLYTQISPTQVSANKTFLTEAKH